MAVPSAAMPPTDPPPVPPPTGYDSQTTGMHPLLAKQPRYCLACGAALPLPSSKGETPRCEHCLRAFDPDDPSTFSPLPHAEAPPWWQHPTLPGVAWLVVYPLGCAVMGAVLPEWSNWLAGGAGQGQRDPRAGQAAGVLLAVLLAVLLFIPWLFACLYLLLVAFERHLRDEVVWYLTAGALLGVFCTLGFHPSLMLVGLVLGVLAGLVRQWRMT